MKKYILSTIVVATILITSFAMMSPAEDVSQRDGAPKGTIVAWSPKYAGSSECPKGWKIADGTDGTPDLRDRFLLGANTGDADVNVEKYLGKSVGHDGSTYQTYNVPSYGVVYIIKQ